MDDDLSLLKVLMANRGYDADHICEEVEQRCGALTIPALKTLKDPEPADEFLYVLHNLVGRCIIKLENARRIATRYDKTATSYLGFSQIVSARPWFRHLST